MRRLLPLLIVAGTLAQGCSDRAHLNPLDPSNPDTQGRPAGFVGLAGNQFVILRWAAPSGTAVRGFRLLRRAGAETEFTELATLLVPGVTGYLDPGLANGVDHAYRLQYVLQAGALSPASETIATPGPLRPWVSDFARGQLVRITADARVNTTEPTSALQSPSDLAADTPRGRIWIADTFAGRVIGYSPATGGEIDLGGLQDPQAIAVAPDNGYVWVCDGSLNQVLLFDPNAPGGAVAVRGVTNPLSVAVDALDGSAWVCERGADRLRHLDASAQPIAAPVRSRTTMRLPAASAIQTRPRRASTTTPIGPAKPPMVSWGTALGDTRTTFRLGNEVTHALRVSESTATRDGPDTTAAAIGWAEASRCRSRSAPRSHTHTDPSTTSTATDSGLVTARAAIAPPGAFGSNRSTWFSPASHTHTYPLSGATATACGSWRPPSSISEPVPGE